MVLYADIHSDERIVYPHQQHAPVGTMHHLRQSIALFMEIMRMVYLKGSSLTDILPQLGTLAIFATVLYLWAIVSYKKQQ